jgi:uncharacterized membrane protein
MVSSHFPAVYGHRLGWLLLLILAATGAAVRHLLNVRFTYKPWIPALAATIALGMLLLSVVLYWPVRPAPAVAAGVGASPLVVPFAEVRRVIDRRCAACHSREPSDISLGAPPAGIAFDTPEQIRALVSRIRERAVTTRTMPPGNKTRITERERAMLGQWIDAGAPLR